MLTLSEADVKQFLDPVELRAAMEQALIAFSTGQVTQPVRTVVPVTAHGGWLGLMPAVYGNVLGTKLVTVFPGNAPRGLHTHNAVIQLFAAETGEPLATMGGRLVTALRTAAVSALALRELGRHNGGVLAILGSGVQARSHYEALRLVHAFEEIRIWSRTPEHAAQLAAEIGARPMSAGEAVRGADVVVTATGAVDPILQGKWLRSGALVIAVGAVGLHVRELDDEAMQGGTIIVDSREAAFRESGDIANSGVEIYAELGEILAGTKAPPEGDRIVFKSLGIAVEDIAAAKLVFDKRRQSRRKSIRTPFRIN